MYIKKNVAHFGSPITTSYDKMLQLKFVDLNVENNFI